MGTLNKVQAASDAPHVCRPWVMETTSLVICVRLCVREDTPHLWSYGCMRRVGVLTLFQLPFLYIRALSLSAPSIGQPMNIVWSLNLVLVGRGGEVYRGKLRMDQGCDFVVDASKRGICTGLSGIDSAVTSRPSPPRHFAQIPSFFQQLVPVAL